MAGTLVRGCRCAVSLGDFTLDFTFDLVIVAIFKSFLGYFLDSIRCRRLDTW